MPQFLVVAGPNGAGKSTFSGRLSKAGALIFDPDEQKLKVEKQYPYISPEAVGSAVTDKYQKFEAKAVASMLHLTVETNLRNEFLAERADFFRGSGYETRLIYMLLPNVAASIDRVNLRVKQKGHFVDAESIKTNFEKGLKRLRSCVLHFDQAMILSAQNETARVTGPELLLIISGSVVRYKAEHIPECYEAITRDVEQASTGRHLPKDQGKT